MKLNICPLTENQMTVQDIYAGGRHYAVSGVGYAPEGEIVAADEQVSGGELPISHPQSKIHIPRQDPGNELKSKIALQECLMAGLLCNDSHMEQEDGQWKVVGDPTEGALIVVADKAGLERQKLDRQMPRLDTIPFESEFQYMATLHEGSTGSEEISQSKMYIPRQESGNELKSKIIYVKGSLEAILLRCNQMLARGGEAIRLNSTEVETQANVMAQQGLRLLAFAKKPAASKQSIEREDMDEGLIFLGLQAMIDPPRQEAIDAVRACQSAGIRVKMITGDRGLTASAFA